MSGIRRDITQTLRLMSNHRGFAGAALLTIALAVGGTSAVFAVVYGVLFRSPPYEAPGRLVRIWETHPGAQAPIPGSKLSGPTFRAWAAAADTVQDIAAFGGRDYTVTAASRVHRMRGTRVTPSLFRVLGVSPSVGRFFTDADAAEGAPPLTVLSNGLWRDVFGRRPWRDWPDARPGRRPSRDHRRRASRFCLSREGGGAARRSAGDPALHAPRGHGAAGDDGHRLHRGRSRA